MPVNTWINKYITFWYWQQHELRRTSNKNAHFTCCTCTSCWSVHTVFQLTRSTGGFLQILLSTCRFSYNDTCHMIANYNHSNFGVIFLLNVFRWLICACTILIQMTKNVISDHKWLAIQRYDMQQRFLHGIKPVTHVLFCLWLRNHMLSHLAWNLLSLHLFACLTNKEYSDQLRTVCTIRFLLKNKKQMSWLCADR